MMDAGEVNIKERICMSRMTYSVSKEEIKDDECGCSYLLLFIVGHQTR
jgi:hypothetical protein